MPWEMVLSEQSTLAWVSLSEIPTHPSFLPALASPLALKKGAGGELGLLKEQHLEKMCVVSPVPKEESSDSLQILWLLCASCSLSPRSLPTAPVPVLWSLPVLGCAGATLPALGSVSG